MFVRVIYQPNKLNALERLKISHMKTFKYKFYFRTKQQEFVTGSKKIDAKNVDDANKKLLKFDLPFHTFSTVQIIKNN
jgi:hypothetical protein